MICSTCRRPLPAGSRTCLRCPKPPAARPATKLPPKPATRVPPKPAPADDLLPDEPAPEPSAAGRAAAAAAAVPIRPRRRMPLRSGGTGAKATIGGALAILLVAGSLGLKVCRVSRGVFGETIENKLVTIPPEGDHVVDQFSTKGAHPALRVPTLPR